MFTIRGGYHGDTFSCMSVCDPDDGMHAMYGGLVPRHLFAPRPPAGLDADLTSWRSEVSALFERHAREVAAVILEPVQNAGGCFTPPEGYFARVREICDHYDVLLISDEVICSWGRLGEWFGAERYGYQPDLITTATVSGPSNSIRSAICSANQLGSSPSGSR